MTQKQPLYRVILHTLALSILLLPLAGCNTTSIMAPWETGSNETIVATQTPHKAQSDEALGHAGLTQAPPETGNTAQGQTQTGAQTRPPTKVAILLPLSGQHGAMGQAMLQAAQLSVFDLNASHFELMPRDTKGTAQGAAQAANSALNDGAQLILGPLFATAVRTVKPIAAQRNVNVIAFSTDWKLGGNNAFLMGFMPFSQVDRITSYAAQNGVMSVGVVAPQDQYGTIATSSFSHAAQTNNIQISETFRFNPQEQNLTPFLKSFTKFEERDRDPNAPLPWNGVFMPVGGQKADSIAGSLSYYGATHDKVRKLGTGLWDDPRVANLPHMQGAWFAAPSPKSRKNFEHKYQSTYGNKPPRLASMAYDAAALAIILNRMGLKTNAMPAYDMASISNPNGFAGVDGIFRFGKNGIVERGLSVLEIRHRRIVEIDPAPRTFQNIRY